MPAGHATGAAEPPGQYEPPGQVRHCWLAAEKTPAQRRERAARQSDFIAEIETNEMAETGFVYETSMLMLYMMKYQQPQKARTK